MANPNSKPTSKPEWTSTTIGSIIEPSGAKKTTGFLYLEGLAYQYLNWFWALVSSWVDWLFGLATGAAKNIVTNGYTETQNYINNLEDIINHTVTIDITGSGFDNNILTIENFGGSGEIILQHDGTPPSDALKSILVTNVKCKVSIKDVSIDGKTTNTGIIVDNSNNIYIDGVSFKDCDEEMIKAINNSIVILGKTTNNVESTGNVAFLTAFSNSKIYTHDWTVSGTIYLTDWAYKARTGGEIFIVGSIQPICAGSTPTITSSGGVIHPYFEINSDASNVTHTLNTANKVSSIKGFIESLGKYIPSGKSIIVDVTYNGTQGASFNVVDFQGSGVLNIKGAGEATTIFTITTQPIISGNGIIVQMNDFGLSSANNVAGISISNNPGKVILDDIDISKGAAGGVGVYIDYAPNVEIGATGAIDFITNDPATCIDITHSKVMIQAATGNGTTYAVNAKECSLVGNASILTGGTVNNTDASSFINKA